MSNTIESNEKGDPFFINDPWILVSPDRLVEFFPTSDQTIEERMNAIARFVVYVGIVFSVYRRNARSLHVGALLIIMLVIIWKFRTSSGTLVHESFTNDSPAAMVTDLGMTKPLNLPCRMPTLQNPMMNPLYGDNPEQRACTGPGIQEMAANLLDQQLREDPEDLFGNMQMQRQFYTVPQTTVVEDRDRYMNWCFRDTPDCKTTGGGECIEQDIRQSRDIFPVQDTGVNI